MEKVARFSVVQSRPRHSRHSFLYPRCLYPSFSSPHVLRRLGPFSPRTESTACGSQSNFFLQRSDHRRNESNRARAPLEGGRYCDFMLVNIAIVFTSDIILSSIIHPLIMTQYSPCCFADSDWYTRKAGVSRLEYVSVSRAVSEIGYRKSKRFR